MEFRGQELEKNISRLIEQAILVITFDGLTPKWTAVSNGRHQLIYKIGHTFTTHPRFEDDIHDILTSRLRETLKSAGYPAELANQTLAMIDRESGEMTIEIPDEIFETRGTQLANLRASITSGLRSGGH